MVAIDVVGLGCIAATWALAGGGGGGLGPYLQAVGSAATSPWSLLRYCLLIAAYSAGLEFVLRWIIQRPISRLGRVGAHLAPPIAAVAYGLTHAVYHPAGVAYALLLGAVTAAAYAWLKDWRPLALWHVQWNALAIGGTLVLAMWSPGDARTAVLTAYKAQEIERGNIIFIERWGWVDRNHYSANQVDRALAWANGAGPDELELRVRLTTAIGSQTPFARRYQRASPARTAEEAWALGCAAVLDFNHQHEAAQEALPWWTGAPTSAFQFDDLPSVLLACLDAHPQAQRSLPERAPASAATTQRWKVEGAAKVAQRAQTWKVPDHLTDRAVLHARLAQILAQPPRAYPSVTSTRRDRWPSPTGTVTVSTP